MKRLTWAVSRRGGGLYEPRTVEVDETVYNDAKELHGLVAAAERGPGRDRLVAELRTLLDFAVLFPGATREETVLEEFEPSYLRAGSSRQREDAALFPKVDPTGAWVPLMPSWRDYDSGTRVTSYGSASTLPMTDAEMLEVSIMPKRKIGFS